VRRLVAVAGLLALPACMGLAGSADRSAAAVLPPPASLFLTNPAKVLQGRVPRQLRAGCKRRANTCSGAGVEPTERGAAQAPRVVRRAAVGSESPRSADERGRDPGNAECAGRVRVLRAGLSEPSGPSDEARLLAIGDLEFGEDAGDVVADGLLAEEELCGDLGVAESLGE
jgi:hypothetical protein